MKFERLLAQQQIPEWRSAYVPYAQLKRQLNFAKRDVLTSLQIMMEHRRHGNQHDSGGDGGDHSESDSDSDNVERRMLADDDSVVVVDGAVAAAAATSATVVSSTTTTTTSTTSTTSSPRGSEAGKERIAKGRALSDSDSDSDSSSRAAASNGGGGGAENVGVDGLVLPLVAVAAAPAATIQEEDEQEQEQQKVKTRRKQHTATKSSKTAKRKKKVTVSETIAVDSGQDDDDERTGVHEHHQGRRKKHGQRKREKARRTRPNVSKRSRSRHGSSSSSNHSGSSSSSSSSRSDDDDGDRHNINTIDTAAAHGVGAQAVVSIAATGTSVKDAADDGGESSSSPDEEITSEAGRAGTPSEAGSELRHRHRPMSHSGYATAYRLLHKRGLACRVHSLPDGSLLSRFKETGFRLVASQDDDVGTIHSLTAERQLFDQDPLRFLLRDLLAEQKFWAMIESAISRIDAFYQERIQDYINRFHAFAARAVQLGLIPFFVPGASGKQSRIERELTRDRMPIRTYASDELALPQPADNAQADEIYPIRIVVRTSILKELMRVKSMISESSDKLTPQDIQQTFQTTIKTTVLPFPVDDATITGGWIDPRSRYFDLSDEGHTDACRYIVSCFYCGCSPEMKAYAENVRQLRRAVREFYRGLILIEDFCTLNIEGFRKVCKKHDKELGTKTQKIVLKSVTEDTNFGRRDLVGVLQTETEALFTRAFCRGHRTAAMDSLRIPPPRDTSKVYWTMGLIIGLSLALSAAILYMLFIYATPTVRDSFLLQSNEGNTRAILIMYRAIAMATFMVWFWGFDMYIWEKYRLNYVFIFEFNPRKHVRFPHMLQAAGWFTLVVLLAFFLFIMSSWPMQVAGFSWLQGNGGAYAFHPLALLGAAIAVFVVSQYRADWWIVRTLARIMGAPFVGPVRFRDFFVGDQLLSIVIVLRDVEFMTCWFVWDAWQDYPVPETVAEVEKRTCFTQMAIAGPLVSALPVTWRFLQCLRRYRDSKDVHQLWNAGKYFSAYIVIVTSALAKVSSAALVLWIIAGALATVFSAYWDFAMDWSLFTFHRGIRPSKLGFKKLASFKFFSVMRRTNTVYTFPFWVYYAAAVINFFLRLLWVATLSPGQFPIDAVLFSTILAVLEIARRGVWNLFRLENEQLSNIGKFRAIKDVPFVATTERLEYLSQFGLGLEFAEESDLHDASAGDDDQDYFHSHHSHGSDDSIELESDDDAAATQKQKSA